MPRHKKRVSSRMKSHKDGKGPYYKGAAGKKFHYTSGNIRSRHAAKSKAMHSKRR